MKNGKKLFLTLLCAALIPMLCACRQDPCPVCGATYVCDCAVVETVTTVPNETATVSTGKAPPAWSVNYAGKQVVLTSGNYTWNIDNGDGTMTCTQACGIRPCDWDETPRIELSALSGSDYMLTFPKDSNVRNMSVTAYPVGQYEDKHATECKVEDGKLAVLKGRYYYELVVHFAQGTATYGFFVQ